MLLSDLIDTLVELKNQHGDIEAVDSNHEPITWVAQVENDDEDDEDFEPIVVIE